MTLTDAKNVPLKFLQKNVNIFKRNSAETNFFGPKSEFNIFENCCLDAVLWKTYLDFFASNA